VRSATRAHGSGQKNHPDETVARDFVNPSKGVREEIAQEHLQEGDRHKENEKGGYDPANEPVKKAHGGFS
jgi:hypothetical protein